MNVIYSSDALKDVPLLGPHAMSEEETCIFLAGPTPRDKETLSWRPEAIELLQNENYKGSVFVPERRDWNDDFDYTTQTEWEDSALNGSTVILFWVPRDLKIMPAFTTNVEFGRFVGQPRIKKTPSGDIIDGYYSVIYGRPDYSAKNGYLDWLYQFKTGKTWHNTLVETIHEAVFLASMFSTPYQKH